MSSIAERQKKESAPPLNANNSSWSFYAAIQIWIIQCHCFICMPCIVNYIFILIEKKCKTRNFNIFRKWDVQLDHMERNWCSQHNVRPQFYLFSLSPPQPDNYPQRGVLQVSASQYSLNNNNKQRYIHLVHINTGLNHWFICVCGFFLATMFLENPRDWMRLEVCSHIWLYHFWHHGWWCT